MKRSPSGTTIGAIDSATGYMVPALMTFKKPGEAFPWARQPALAFTLAGLFLRNAVLSANPVVASSASGLWATFLSSLGETMKVETVTAGRLREQALKTTHELGHDHSTLQGSIASLRRHDSFDAWLLWHTQYEWVEHTRRLGGFFDYEFIKEVSSCTNVSVSEIEAIWRRTSEPEAAARLGQRVRAGTLDDGDSLAIDAWLTATIMRGHYHDELAKKLGRQHFRHPVRSLSRRDGVQNTSQQLFSTNDAQRHFAAILLGLSLSATDPSARLRLYGENLTRCRSAIATGQLHLGDATVAMTDDVGLDRAVREAQALVRKGVLKVDSRRFVWGVDASIGLAAAMSGFSLSPWVGVIVGASTAVAQTIIEPGKRALTVRDSSRRRLQDLAHAVAGSVDIIAR